MEDIFYVQAVGGDTLVRLRNRKPRQDLRTLDEIEQALQEAAFFRVGRSHIVNLDRVSEVRVRAAGRDWEVVMEPPVNHVLPISRGAHQALIEALQSR